MRSVPIALMRSRIEFCAPVPMASITTELTPMMMPRRQDRSEDVGPQGAHRHLHRFRNIGDAGGTAFKALPQPERRLRIGNSSFYRIRERIWPSRISISRSARSATSRACVMTICATLRVHGAQQFHHIFAALVVDAPVGSSARMMRPPFMSARAMETRWRWPPESWFGR